MENIAGVYCIENTINKKKYIGSSKNTKKRKNRHFSELKNKKHKNSKLQNSYNKYGKEAFIFYVLLIVSDITLLINEEQRLIDEFKPELNINLIANSSLGVKRSSETKEKVRQANLGLKHPEWRNKIKSEAQGGDNHWTKKKNFSEDSKKKMSESQKKLFKNGYKHPRKGIKENFKTIEEKRIRASKAVVQYDLNGTKIEEFSSIKEAYNKYGYSVGLIIQCCKNKRKKYKNYVWKYK